MKAWYFALLMAILVSLISPIGGAAETAEIGVSHPPGTYIHDIWLYLGDNAGLPVNHVNSADEQPSEYMYRFGDGPWLRVQGPLLLSAAPGEIRRHLIEVARVQQMDSTELPPQDLENTVELEYYIHRRSPPTPRPLTAPGLYTDNIQVELPEMPDMRISYSLDGVSAVYDGSPVSISVEPGGYRHAEFITQSIDSLGRVSEPGVFTYILDRREQSDAASVLGDLPPADLTLFFPPWYTAELETDPNDRRLLVVAKAPAGAHLRYTLDDTVPSAASDTIPFSGYFTTLAPTTRFPVEVPPLRVRVETIDGRLGPEIQLSLPGSRPAVPVVTEDRSEPGVLVLTPESPSEHPEADFRFEISTNGELAPHAGADSPRLLPGTAIRVTAGETRSISYTVVRLNADGMSSEPLVRAPAEVGHPVPAAPRVQVAADGTVVMQGTGSIFYQVDEPDEGVLDTGKGWFQYAGPFRLPAVHGRRTSFRVNSYTTNDSGVRSAVSSATMTIDLRRPDLQLLEDLRPPERPYPGSAELKFTAFDPDLQVRYEVFENGGSTPTHIGRANPGGQILLNAPSNPQRVEYSVMLSAMYPGSTLEPYRSETTVVIDNRPPGEPQIAGVEIDEIYFGQLRPDIRPAAGGNVAVSLHRVETDGGLQHVADLLPHEQILAERFGTGKFVLRVESGTAAGITRNHTQVPFELRGYSDPEPRVQATVTHAPDTSTVFLSHGHGERIRYALDYAEPATRVQDLEFREYIMPLRVPRTTEHHQADARTDAVPQRIVFATLPYSQDHSEISPAAWPLMDAPAFPELQDGGLYNNEILLELSSVSSGPQDNPSTPTLRVEIAAGSLALPVSAVSPVLASPLRVDPGEDAAQAYHLRAAWFSGVTQVSPELQLRFSIDRIPPEPPAMIGVENMAHLDNNVQISFRTTDSSDQVLYRVLENTELLSSPPEVSPEEKLTLYDGNELSFEVDAGEYRAVSVEAFTQDDAGNLSRESTVTQFVLDRAVAYVSATTSTQDAERSGGRQTPFSELAAAVELAFADNRSLIQVGPGRYELDQVLRLSRTATGPNAVRIQGMAANDADVARERPVIHVSSNGGFHLQDLPLSLENLTLEAAPQLETALLRLTQSSSELHLRNVQLLLHGAARALEVVRGTAQIEDTMFAGRSMTTGPFLQLSGGETEMTRVVFDLDGSAGTYRAIEIGTGASLLAETLKIAAEPQSGLFTALHTSGKLELRDSQFDLSGGQGLIALRSTDGQVTAHSTEFELYGAAEFAYGLFLGAPEAHATAVHVRVAGSLDDAALVLERGELTLRNSRLELAEARGRSTGFRLSGGRAELYSVDLVHHRIAAPGRFRGQPDEDTAVAIDAAGRDMLSFDRLRIAGFPILLRPPRIPGVLRAPAPVRSPGEFNAYFDTGRADALQVYEDSSELSW